MALTVCKLGINIIINIFRGKMQSSDKVLCNCANRGKIYLMFIYSASRLDIFSPKRLSLWVRVSWLLTSTKWVSRESETVLGGRYQGEPAKA